MAHRSDHDLLHLHDRPRTHWCWRCGAVRIDWKNDRFHNWRVPGSKERIEEVPPCIPHGNTQEDG